MKKILVFSNGEKVGDGIIKLQLLHEIKKRLPDYKLYWITDKGKTVYSSILNNIASKYIDVFYEQANISPYFFFKISKKFNFDNEFFDYILDTQKSVLRTIAIKRINHSSFISGTAGGFFSSKKIKHIKKNKKYYLNYIFDLLDLIKKQKLDDNFSLTIDLNLHKLISKILSKEKNYAGVAPGAGEKNKIWSIENFFQICDFFKSKNFELVFFIGPEEMHLKKKLNKYFPNSIFIEDLVKDYSNIEIIMSSTKFLRIAISNDSGVSHMLSTGYCPLIKLFGPKDSEKFTPVKKNLFSISSNEYNSTDINKIPVKRVIKEINNILQSSN